MTVKLLAAETDDVWDKCFTICAEIKFRLLGDYLVLLFLVQIAFKPVCHAIVIGPKYECELIELQSDLIVILPDLRLLVCCRRACLVVT